MSVYNFPNYFKGDTFLGITFTLQEGDPAAAVNLTGATIRIQWRFKSATGTLQKEVSIGDGITVDNAAGGIFSIDPFSLVDWDAGRYFYDVEITNGGETRTYFSGTWTIIEDVTKPATP